jgi:hypothetical protein
MSVGVVQAFLHQWRSELDLYLGVVDRADVPPGLELLDGVYELQPGAAAFSPFRTNFTSALHHLRESE